MNTRFDEIENKIKGLLASYLESSGLPELEQHGAITGDTNLVSDFTLDSFQVMEFLMEMEVGILPADIVFPVIGFFLNMAFIIWIRILNQTEIGRASWRERV